MGNAQNSPNSNSNAGVIVITTDKPYYTSGENVTGYLQIKCFQPFNGSQVALIVDGRETTYLRESYTVTTGTGKNRRTRRKYRTFRGQNQFFCHRFVIYQFPSQLLPGEYSFPFQFALPAHLPGSYFENSASFQAFIKYGVQGEIINSSNQNDRIFGFSEFVVREPLKQLVQQQQGESNVNLKTWCCINQGQSKIKSYFQTNTYCPGETAVMITEMDNSLCGLDVKALRAEILKVVVVRFNNGVSRNRQSVVATQSLPGIKAGEKKVGSEGFQNSLGLINQYSQELLQPSTNGNLIVCSYRVRIISEMDGCTCCSDQPVIQVPINLVSPPLASFNAVQQPQGWNPQIFPVYLVNFSNEYQYQMPQQQNIYGIQTNHDDDEDASQSGFGGVNRQPQVNNQFGNQNFNQIQVVPQVYNQEMQNYSPQMVNQQTYQQLQQQQQGQTFL